MNIEKYLLKIYIEKMYVEKNKNMELAIFRKLWSFGPWSLDKVWPQYSNLSIGTIKKFPIYKACNGKLTVTPVPCNRFEPKLIGFFRLTIWTCVRSFMKIGWSVFEISCSQTDRQTDRQTFTLTHTLIVETPYRALINILYTYSSTTWQKVLK